MATERTVRGEMGQYEQPEWKPLEEALADHILSQFMWMGEIRLETGEVLHAYKHRLTRRYLHLAADGTTYVYRGERGYAPTDAAEAVAAALHMHREVLAGGTGGMPHAWWALIDARDRGRWDL